MRVSAAISLRLPKQNATRQPAMLKLLDMVLNSTLLGEEACSELIERAARARLEQILR